jgi:hypothetical protein
MMRAPYRTTYLNSTRAMRTVHRHHGGLYVPAVIELPKARKPYSQKWREAEATQKKDTRK